MIKVEFGPAYFVAASLASEKIKSLLDVFTATQHTNLPTFMFAQSILSQVELVVEKNGLTDADAKRVCKESALLGMAAMYHLLQTQAGYDKVLNDTTKETTSHDDEYWLEKALKGSKE